MCGFIKFRLGFFGVPHFPIKGQVARRLGVDICIPRSQCQLHGQFIIIKFNQLGRIAGLLHRIGNNHRNRLTHMAHAVRCQQGTRWFCPITAIAVFHNRAFQIHGDACRNQIIRRNHSGDTLAFARITDVQIGDHAMRNGRAENKRLKRIGRCDIVDVFTKSCQKTLVF